MIDSYFMEMESHIKLLWEFFLLRFFLQQVMKNLKNEFCFHLFFVFLVFYNVKLYSLSIHISRDKVVSLSCNKFLIQSVMYLFNTRDIYWEKVWWVSYLGGVQNRSTWVLLRKKAMNYKSSSKTNLYIYY